jgi:inosine/xanthosine triphosphate pyrophosphatase family protein
MREITFVTSNTHKLNTARLILGEFNITPLQAIYDIIEIQHDNPEAIARDKADKAFKLVGAPVVITDDVWEIPALKNFPGPYMHAVNNYFTADDWLRLTAPLTDRRIILQQQLVYQDADVQQLFTATIEGVILPAIAGKTADESFSGLVSFDGGAHSVAQMRGKIGSAITTKETAWHKLGEWLQKQKTPHD